RTVHELSPRHDHPWVAINCSAIPRDLMESELFGYVKGAFTGATQNRLGRLEQANGGTLFLDEIADLDLALQAKLLRVVQEREFSPVGSDQVRRVDVRFLAASNRDLKQMVREGKFREDLLYRLDVYHIVVPSLRERCEDIPLLAESFLHDFRGATGKTVRGFSPAVLEVMARYGWPGNVRELRNAVERSLLSCRGESIEVGDLPQAVLEAGTALPSPAADTRPVDQDLDGWLTEVERRAILEALAACHGVQAQAARRLGVSERSLWHRIKKLNIQVTRSAG
ncbi:MAG: sigma-54 dependent transcriptional regulator, partial [Pseudomonadota bacterium]